ncbi:MAG: CehA/McbA family metallohydrolase [Planctomycetes bacterium]|nr:CehA/McbA family metallohydrolase [Planctomycetota bacterium]
MIAPLSLLLVLAVSSCAGFAYDRTTHEIVIGGETLHDFKGATHVHSKYSHDSTSEFDDILAGAIHGGLDFIFITDHNNGESKEWEGFYDDERLLVLSGIEYSTNWGHLLIYNGGDFVPDYRDVPTLIETVRAQSPEYLAIAAHPSSSKKPFDHPESELIDGMEIINLSTLFYDACIPEMILNALLLGGIPGNLLLQTLYDKPKKNLAMFDAIGEERAFIATGSTDAHGRFPLVDSYSKTLPTITTHVFARSLSPESIYEAMRRGRTYVALDASDDAKGFEFYGRSRGSKLLPGEEIDLAEDAELIARTPVIASIRLVESGRVVKKVDGRFLKFEAVDPGFYRVEVNLRGRPWIYSSGIRIN